MIGFLPTRVCAATAGRGAAYESSDLTSSPKAPDLGDTRGSPATRATEWVAEPGEIYARGHRRGDIPVGTRGYRVLSHG